LTGNFSSDGKKTQKLNWRGTIFITIQKNVGFAQSRCREEQAPLSNNPYVKIICAELKTGVPEMA
jgi:hypothetical protein